MASLSSGVLHALLGLIQVKVVSIRARYITYT